MASRRPGLRWSVAVLLALGLIGVLVLAVQRGEHPDGEPAADRAARTPGTTDGVPEPTTDGAPPAPTSTTDAHERAAVPDEPERSPEGAGSRGATADGTGDRRTGRSGPAGSGDGGCAAPPEGAQPPLAPVSVDAPAAQIRRHVGEALQRLQETSPPPALRSDWEGLRGYYRRVGQLAGAEGPLDAAGRRRVERLNRTAYPTFAPPVIAFLRQRC